MRPGKRRYIALVFDDISMPAPDAVNSRRAAEQFVRESLSVQDLVGVFTTSALVIQNFTGDRDALIGALAKVQSHFRRPDYGPGTCPQIGVYQAYMILRSEGVHSPYLDLALDQIKVCPNAHCQGSGSNAVGCIEAQARETVALAEQYGLDSFGVIDDVIRALSKTSGQKIMLLASTGFWSQTLPQQRERVIDAALHAGVVINALDAKGLHMQGYFASSEGPPITMRGSDAMLQQEFNIRQSDMLDDPLAMLADATGGRFFHNNNDLGRGLREMAAVPEVSYVLGFSPDNPKPDGKFHELKVIVIGHKDYTVTTRKGYFVPLPEKHPERTAAGRRVELDHEVLAGGARNAIPVELDTEATSDNSGGGILKVSLKINIQRLPFARRNDRSVQRLILVTALFDTKNHFLKGVQGIMDLDLTDATLAQLSTRGLDAKLSLQAPPGTYRLRQVVQEEASGRLTALDRQVEIQQTAH